MPTIINNPNPNDRGNYDSGTGWGVAIIILILIIAAGLIFWARYYKSGTTQVIPVPQTTNTPTRVDVNLPDINPIGTTTNQ